MEKMGEGMRIHISSSSKDLLDKVGGYRYVNSERDMLQIS